MHLCMHYCIQFILLTAVVNRIINDTMKIKEILKEGWDVFPPWLMALNILAIVIGLAVILFV